MTAGDGSGATGSPRATIREMARDVPNPRYDQRCRVGVRGVATFATGRRFALEEVEGPSPGAGVRVRSRTVLWGRVTLRDAIRLAPDAPGWASRDGSLVAALVDASREVEPRDNAEVRAVHGLDADDDGSIVDALLDDPGTRESVLAAMGALSARRAATTGSG